jgi:hypothetical protein
MAHSYHHALSSARKWGGAAEDYLAIYTWFDRSKEIVADFRHRALRHHAEGIFLAEQLFGVTITNSCGRLSTCGRTSAVSSALQIGFGTSARSHGWAAWGF